MLEVVIMKNEIVRVGWGLVVVGWWGATVGLSLALFMYANSALVWFMEGGTVF